MNTERAKILRHCYTLRSDVFFYTVHWELTGPAWQSQLHMWQLTSTRSRPPLLQQQRGWPVTGLCLSAVGNTPPGLWTSKNTDIQTEDWGHILHLEGMEDLNTNWTLDLLVEKALTHLGEVNMVLCATLWTVDCSSTVSFLLLIKPALQTGLVDPFSAAFTPARAYPLGTAVISLSGETHPAVSGKSMHTYALGISLYAMV